MRHLASIFLAFLALTAGAVEWRNIDAVHHLGGRKASSGYLQGKVVLVLRWDERTEDVPALLRRAEEIWEGFKTKQFILLGSSVGGVATRRTKEAVGAAGISFPLYEGAGLVEKEPGMEKTPYYVTDETGKVVYLGRDERVATQAVVGALTDMESPRNVKQWKRFLDHELACLPAHAYLRLNEFRKKFPDEAASYVGQARELVALPNVKEVSDLVDFARRAKDAPKFGADEREKKVRYEALVNEVLEKCAPLKGTPDPRLRQEVKNSLADLSWVKAAF